MAITGGAEVITHEVGVWVCPSGHEIWINSGTRMLLLTGDPVAWREARTRDLLASAPFQSFSGTCSLIGTDSAAVFFDGNGRIYQTTHVDRALHCEGILVGTMGLQAVASLPGQDFIVLPWKNYLKERKAIGH